MAKRTRRARATISVKATGRMLRSKFKLDVNVHHRWHPGRDYAADRIARDFRQLPCQRQIMFADEHVEEHRDTHDTPPQKPPRSVMEKQLNTCRNRGCDTGLCTLPIKFVVRNAEIDPAALPPHVQLVTG